MSLGSYLWSDSQKNISPVNFKAKTTISQNYLRCAASCALCNFSALPTKQAEKVWEYQGAGVGMRFLFALLRPHTRYYAVHAMADLTSQSPIPSFQNRRNWATFVKSSEQCFGAGPFLTGSGFHFSPGAGADRRWTSSPHQSSYTENVISHNVFWVFLS